MKHLYESGPDTIIAESAEQAAELMELNYPGDYDPTTEYPYELEGDAVRSVMLEDSGHITDSGESTKLTIAEWLEHPEVKDLPCPSIVWSTEW